ncbi:efflux RND transporter periplasmic adaptor subunit [Permianibacter sp. IMCC34836]|uniref:efflux RND transporter periplasmic adaptor subunit n=1 Tax=Permianibacter fluminis TaxID=2738515 RepID=UPI001554923C|nr:efflux RND transporter periplasmic adaptor subunit [Permianibacter fluminis]NQD38267.1 efflux RND transporter periplasmic adaptor subunit [Permianibacter fluminis]
MSFSLWRSAGISAGLFVSLFFFSVAAHSADGFSVTDEQMRALGVELITLKAQSDAAGARFPAQVVLPPDQENVLSAPFAGVITQMLVQENQKVSTGTALLVLSGPEFGALQLDLVQTSNRLRLARASLQRDQELFAEGIIPRRRLDESDAAARDAEAGQTHSRAALALAGVDAVQLDRIATSAAVSNELTLKAQRSGTVVALAVKTGQRVNAADPLLRLVRSEKLWLDIQVPSGSAVRWQKGQRVHVVGGAEAEVLSASALTSSAQTVTLRAQLRAGASPLRPGEFVQVELPISEASAWEVPLSAIARHDNHSYVFVRDSVNKDSFVAVAVTVLANAGQRAQIQGELKVGQRIAVSSIVALKAAWLGLGGAEEE